MLSKTCDSCDFQKKHDKFANEKWKGVISEKIRAKTCFADKALSSWTGLGRSGHVRITTFGPISYISGLEMNFRMRGFAWR